MLGYKFLSETSKLPYLLHEIFSPPVLGIYSATAYNYEPSDEVPSKPNKAYHCTHDHAPFYSTGPVNPSFIFLSLSKP